MRPGADSCCFLCGINSSLRRLEAHHPLFKEHRPAYRRNGGRKNPHIIPGEIAITPQLLVWVCRPCHTLIHRETSLLKLEFDDWIKQYPNFGFNCYVAVIHTEYEYPRP